MCNQKDYTHTPFWQTEPSQHVRNVGDADGLADGVLDGAEVVGLADGALVVGLADGAFVGFLDGAEVVGLADGAADGFAIGKGNPAGHTHNPEPQSG